MLSSRRRAIKTIFAAAIGGAVMPRAAVRAETPNARNFTTIKVDDMHCISCAKKIAGRLYALPGVLRVHADVPKNLAFVVPQPNNNPSPRKMWQAVEEAGFKPLLMDGPGGRYTAKPSS